jgi:hypothetical protein
MEPGTCDMPNQLSTPYAEADNQETSSGHFTGGDQELFWSLRFAGDKPQEGRNGGKQVLRLSFSLYV